MKLQMFVIFDACAQVYNKPFCQINEQVAVRCCQDLVNDPGTDCSKSPHDYSLFHIGTYDDEHAEIKIADTHKCVCRFHELVKHHKPFAPIEGNKVVYAESRPAHAINDQEKEQCAQ